MKKFFSFTIFIGMLFISSPVYGQDVRDMINMGIATANYLESAGRGVEILHAEFDQLSTSNNTRSAIRTLYEQTYRIAAFSDDNITDIDIVVYRQTGDNTWIEVARDNSANPLAFVEITPYSTSNYKIDVKAYTFRTTSALGYYGLMICSETGNSNSTMRDHLTYTYESINQDKILSNYSVLRAEFDIINENISGSTKSCYRELLPGVSYSAAAMGGSYTEDIDLKIFRDDGDDQWEECCSDVSSQQIAVVKIPEYSGGSYRFDTKVYKFIPGYNADVYSFLLLMAKP